MVEKGKTSFCPIKPQIFTLTQVQQEIHSEMHCSLRLGTPSPPEGTQQVVFPSGLSPASQFQENVSYI